MLYRLILVALGAALACLAALQAVLAAAMLGYPAELMYGESILYDHARRILQGASLYQPLANAPYTVANYTPLYYLLVAAGQIVLPGFAPGRLIALTALLAAIILVTRLAMDHDHGWGTGLLAALLFAALGVPGSGSIPWTALYKEDSLALALALGALLGLRRGQPVVAGLLGAAAVLTKQTSAALVLAPIAWLWLNDRRACGPFLGSLLAPVALVSLGLECSTHAYLANVVLANVNPISVDWLRSNLVLFALFGLGTLVAAGLGWRKAKRDGLLALAWLGAANCSLWPKRAGPRTTGWPSPP